MIEIRAADHIDPNGLIVRSGELLARRVIESLRSGESVHIDLRGLSGISSSYFNILLRLIYDEAGAAAIDRVQLAFVSPLQKQVFDRSLEAIRQGSVVRNS